MRDAVAERISDTLAVTALVGNPKPRSRTRSVAEAVASAVAGGLAEAGRPSEFAVVDLGELGPRVLDRGDRGVDDGVNRVRQSRLLVVASPTYKASYSGLLKAFLDRLPALGLEGMIAVPVMVGATPRHFLALDTNLRPLLVELGASCPTAGLFVLEQELEQLDLLVADWRARWLESVLALTGSVPDTAQQER